MEGGRQLIAVITHRISEFTAFYVLHTMDVNYYSCKPINLSIQVINFISVDPTNLKTGIALTCFNIVKHMFYTMKQTLYIIYDFFYM